MKVSKTKRNISGKRTRLTSTCPFFMSAYSGKFEVVNLKYPCYVSKLPDMERFLHIPQESEVGELECVQHYVLEGYRDKNSIFLTDCIDVDSWKKKYYPRTCEQRQVDLRSIINNQFSFNNKVRDLPLIIIDNPGEMIKECRKHLKNTSEGVRILDIDGFYAFGEATNKQYYEIRGNL